MPRFNLVCVYAALAGVPFVHGAVASLQQTETLPAEPPAAVVDPTAALPSPPKAGVSEANGRRYRNALRSFTQTQEIIRKTGNKAAEAKQLFTFALLCHQWVYSRKALECLGQALILYQKIGNKVGQGQILNWLGVVYLNLGQTQKVLYYFGQALPLWRQTGYKRGEAVLLNYVGSVYRDLGQTQKGLDDFDRASMLYHKIGNKQEEAFKRLAPKFRYLHLATHGFVNDTVPLLSSLVLAEPPVSGIGSDEDGFLTARELLALDLSRVEMTVLYACNTAWGQN